MQSDLYFEKEHKFYKKGDMDKVKDTENTDNTEI